MHMFRSIQKGWWQGGNPRIRAIPTTGRVAALFERKAINFGLENETLPQSREVNSTPELWVDRRPA